MIEAGADQQPSLEQVKRALSECLHEIEQLQAELATANKVVRIQLDYREKAEAETKLREKHISALAKERDRLRAALETCAEIGETRVAVVARRALEGGK